MIISEKLTTKVDLSNRNLTDRIDRDAFDNIAQISDTTHALMTITRLAVIAMQQLIDTMVAQSRITSNTTKQLLYSMRGKYAGETVQQQWW